MKKKPLNPSDVKIDFQLDIVFVGLYIYGSKTECKKVLVHQPPFTHKHLPLN